MGGMYARSALGPMLEALRGSLSLSDEQVAVLQGPALAAPLLLSSIPVGMIIDRFSRRGVLVASLALSAVATGLGAVAPTFYFLFATRCVVGACAPASAIAAYSFLADMYSPETRGRATTAVLLGQLAGTAAAFAIGGQLLMLAHSPTGWRTVMILTACALLPTAGLALLLQEPWRIRGVDRRLSLQLAKSEMWRHRRLIATLIAGMAMVNLADGAALVWTAPTLSRNFGLTAGRVGTLTGSALLVAGLLGPLIGGPLADLCHRTGGSRRTVLLVAGLAFLCVPAGLFGSFPDETVAVVSLTVFLMLANAISVSVIAITVVVIPNEIRGLTMTLQWGSGALFGLGLAPVLVSEISGRLGGARYIGTSLAMVCATTALIGTLIFLASRRTLAPT